MATIEDAIYSKLSGTSGITALVGRRIYPVVLPQKCKLPAITYDKVSDPQIHTMGSESNPCHPRFTIHVWGETLKNVIDIAEQVKTALKYYTGTIASMIIQRIYYDNETDIYEPQTETYHRALDFLIWY